MGTHRCNAVDQQELHSPGGPPERVVKGEDPGGRCGHPRLDRTGQVVGRVGNLLRGEGLVEVCVGLDHGRHD